MDNFYTASEQQMREASLIKFAEFCKAFDSLPEPKYVRYFPHPEQVEELEEI